LIELCKHSMPNYMIPTGWVFMNELPMNKNGKVDRKQLPVPILHTFNSHIKFDDENLTHSQFQFKEIVAKVLSVALDSFSFYSSLPDIGTSSLQIIQLLTALRSKYNTDISLSHLLKNHSLNELYNITSNGRQSMSVLSPRWYTKKYQKVMEFKTPQKQDRVESVEEVAINISDEATQDSISDTLVSKNLIDVFDETEIVVDDDATGIDFMQTNFIQTHPLGSAFGVIFLASSLCVAVAISVSVINSIPYIGTLFYSVKFPLYALMVATILSLQYIVLHYILLRFAMKFEIFANSIPYERYTTWLMTRYWKQYVLVHFLFQGTEIYNVYLRALGMKIGCNTYIYTQYIDVHTDCIHIGSNVIISKDSVLHVFTNQELSSSSAEPLKNRCLCVEDNAVIGERVVIEAPVIITKLSYVKPLRYINSNNCKPNSVDVLHDPLLIKQFQSRNMACHLIQTLFPLSVYFVLFQPVAWFILSLFSSNFPMIMLPICMLPLLLTFWNMWIGAISMILYRLLVLAPTNTLIPIGSLEYIQKVWMQHFLLKLASTSLGYYALTPIISWFLRLAGANIHSSVAFAGPCSGISCHLSAISIEHNVFSASNVYFGANQVSNGCIVVSQPITIEAGSFIGNDVVLQDSLPALSTVSALCSYENSSIIKNSKYSGVILGIPAAIMPFKHRNEMVQESQYNTISLVAIHIGLIILNNTILCLSLAPCAILSYVIANNATTAFTFYAVFVLTLTIVASLVVSLVFILCKKLTIEFDEQPHLLHSYWFQKRTFYYIMFTSWFEYAGSMIEESYWYSFVFKMIGANVGKCVLINGTLMEPDLVEIGDGSIIGEQSFIQPHTFEDKVFRMKRIKVGKECAIGSSVVVLPGATINDGVIIEPNSLVLRDENLPAKSHWQGSPLNYIQNQEALYPT